MTEMTYKEYQQTYDRIVKTTKQNITNVKQAVKLKIKSELDSFYKSLYSNIEGQVQQEIRSFEKQQISKFKKMEKQLKQIKLSSKILQDQDYNDEIHQKMKKLSKDFIANCKNVDYQEGFNIIIDVDYQELVKKVYKEYMNLVVQIGKNKVIMYKPNIEKRKTGQKIREFFPDFQDQTLLQEIEFGKLKEINKEVWHSKQQILKSAIQSKANKLTECLLQEIPKLEQDYILGTAVYNLSSVKVIRELISKGALVNAVYWGNETPLHAAAASSNSNADVIRVLIENGAKVDALGKVKCTPLHEAAQSNSNADVLRVLIENGANVNAINKRNQTPLHQAAKSNKNPDVVRVLIENGANIHALNNVHCTPLHKAVQSYKQNIDVVRVLIENGANIDALNKKNQTPLHLAAQKIKKTDVLRFLIENGANIDALNERNQTPLHIAAKRFGWQTDVVQILVEKGANLFIQNFAKKTPFNVCMGLDKKQIIQNAIKKTLWQ